LVSWEQGHWDAEARIHHVRYVYEHRDGRQEISHLQLRMFELALLHSLLARAGFRLDVECQDFVGTPMGKRPLKWVAALTAV
jgi:uncharacterized protein YhjY with autotransporter beta-barrel domain